MLELHNEEGRRDSGCEERGGSRDSRVKERVVVGLLSLVAVGIGRWSCGHEEHGGRHGTGRWQTRRRPCGIHFNGGNLGGGARGNLGPGWGQPPHRPTRQL
jgi:hypothetical protein